MRKNRWLSNSYIGLVMAFLYAPIFVLIVFSFNESKSRNTWDGFSLHWYKELFHDEAILTALAYTLIIALVSSLIATVLGTAAALGIDKMNRRLRSLVMSFTYLPMINPEIITGVSLMLLFVVVKDGFAWANQNLGWALPENVFGLPTLLVAHISFCLPYVIFNVSPKLRQLDVRVYEAALDLGCNPKQAFFKVVLPELAPAILSAFLICLTYSIDDFMISYFNCGTMQTLPIAIYSMTRKKVSPEINALSAIMFLVILTIILVSNHMDSRAYRRNQAAIRKSAAEA